MGSSLGPNGDEAPGFSVSALRDPLSAPLDRAQIVKGWVEDGEVKEIVYDVACSGARSVDAATRRLTIYRRRLLKWRGRLRFGWVHSNFLLDALGA